MRLRWHLRRSQFLSVDLYENSDVISPDTVVHDDVEISTQPRALSGPHGVVGHLERTASIVEHRKRNTRKLWIETS